LFVKLNEYLLFLLLSFYCEVERISYIDKCIVQSEFVHKNILLIQQQHADKLLELTYICVTCYVDFYQKRRQTNLEREEISPDFKRSHRRISCTIKFPKSSAKQEAWKALTYFMDVDLNFKSFVWFTLD